MDYGIPAQNDSKKTQDAFFTASAGNNEQEISPESEKNLDLSNQTIDWNHPIERNPGTMGNNVMNALEFHDKESNDVQNQPEKSVEMEMPPGSEPEVEEKAINQPNPTGAINYGVIKTGKVLSKDGIKEASRAIERFKKDGDAAKFNDEVYDMARHNLKNSFGREIPE